MDCPSMATPSLPERTGQNCLVSVINRPWLISEDEYPCSQLCLPTQHICVFTALHRTVLRGAVSACYLMQECTGVLPWVMMECIRVAGLPLLSTSKGILHRTAPLYYRKGSAVGVVAGGGWMGITHRWPRLASNQSHTHLSNGASHKNTGTEGKRIHHSLYSCTLVWDWTAKMRFCRFSIWWSSERWQDSYLLFNVPNYEQGHWRAN